MPEQSRRWHELPPLPLPVIPRDRAQGRTARVIRGTGQFVLMFTDGVDSSTIAQRMWEREMPSIEADYGAKLIIEIGPGCKYRIVPF